MNFQQDLDKLINILDKSIFQLTDYKAKPLGFHSTEVIVGPPQIGKTDFALAHFGRPLHVQCFNDFKRLDTSHDGIVVDIPMLNRQMPMDALIAFMDYWHNCTLYFDGGIVVRILSTTKRIIILHDERYLFPNLCDPNVTTSIRMKTTINRFLEPLWERHALTGNLRSDLKEKAVDEVKYVALAGDAWNLSTSNVSMWTKTKKAVRVARRNVRWCSWRRFVCLMWSIFVIYVIVWIMRRIDDKECFVRIAAKY